MKGGTASVKELKVTLPSGIAAVTIYSTMAPEVGFGPCSEKAGLLIIRLVMWTATGLGFAGLTTASAIGLSPAHDAVASIAQTVKYNGPDFPFSIEPLSDHIH
jgi:hypothetical protein